jgi:hypothetical protein
VTHFSEGRESVADRQIRTASNEQSWRKLCKSYQIVHENRLLTVRIIAEQANIDRETVRKILTEGLDMRKVCAKMVPRSSPKNTLCEGVFS